MCIAVALEVLNSLATHYSNYDYFPEPQPSLVHRKQMGFTSLSTTFEVSIPHRIPFTFIARICSLYEPHSTALSIIAAIFSCRPINTEWGQ